MSPSYVEDRIARSEDEHQCPRHVAHRYTWLLRVAWESTATKWVVAIVSIATAADLAASAIDAITFVVGSSSHRCYRSISRCRLAARAHRQGVSYVASRTTSLLHSSLVVAGACGGSLAIALRRRQTDRHGSRSSAAGSGMCELRTAASTGAGSTTERGDLWLVEGGAAEHTTRGGRSS